MTRSRRRRGVPVGVGSLLGPWARRHHFEEPMRRSTLVLRWREFVGERLAARTRPVRLKDGVLTLRVANNVWLAELTFLREELLAQLNERLGGRPLRALRLVIGPLDTLPSPPRPKIPTRFRPPEVSPERWQAALLRASRELPRAGDEALREAMLRARAAQIVSKFDVES